MPACRVAATAVAFSDAVVDYLHLGAETRRTAALAIDFESLSWDRTLAPVYDILENAARRA